LEILGSTSSTRVSASPLPPSKGKKKPHFIVLVVLAIFAIIIAWFAVLFTGRYPRALFDHVVGVGRWVLRVQAYATLLVTDRYPAFSLK